MEKLIAELDAHIREAQRLFVIACETRRMETCIARRVEVETWLEAYKLVAGRTWQ